jgi:hypothetical protein
MISFKQYIEAQPITVDPRGDFIAETISIDLPDVQTWDQLKFFLQQHHACRAAIEAGACIWKDYLRQRK